VADETTEKVAKKTSKPKSRQERKIADKEAKIDEYLSNEGRKVQNNPQEGVEGTGRQCDILRVLKPSIKHLTLERLQIRLKMLLITPSEKVGKQDIS
jgi:hypothetical protein